MVVVVTPFFPLISMLGSSSEQSADVDIDEVLQKLNALSIDDTITSLEGLKIGDTTDATLTQPIATSTVDIDTLISTLEPIGTEATQTWSEGWKASADARLESTLDSLAGLSTGSSTDIDKTITSLESITADMKQVSTTVECGTLKYMPTSFGKVPVLIDSASNWNKTQVSTFSGPVTGIVVSVSSSVVQFVLGGVLVSMGVPTELALVGTTLVGSIIEAVPTMMTDPLTGIKVAGQSFRAKLTGNVIGTIVGQFGFVGKIGANVLTGIIVGQGPVVTRQNYTPSSLTVPRILQQAELAASREQKTQQQTVSIETLSEESQQKWKAFLQERIETVKRTAIMSAIASTGVAAAYYGLKLGETSDNFFVRYPSLIAARVAETGARAATTVAATGATAATATASTLASAASSNAGAILKSIPTLFSDQGAAGAAFRTASQSVLSSLLNPVSKPLQTFMSKEIDRIFDAVESKGGYGKITDAAHRDKLRSELESNWMTALAHRITLRQLTKSIVKSTIDVTAGSTVTSAAKYAASTRTLDQVYADIQTIQSQALQEAHNYVKTMSAAGSINITDMFNHLWAKVDIPVTQITTTAPVEKQATISTWKDAPLSEESLLKSPQYIQGQGYRFEAKLGETRQQYQDRHFDEFLRRNPTLGNTLSSLGTGKGLAYHGIDMMASPLSWASQMSSSAQKITALKQTLDPVIRGAFWAREAKRIFDKSQPEAKTEPSTTFGLYEMASTVSKAAIDATYAATTALDVLSLTNLLPQSIKTEMEVNFVRQGAAAMGWDPFTSQTRAVANIVVGTGVAQRTVDVAESISGLFRPEPDPGLFASSVSDRIDTFVDVLTRDVT